METHYAPPERADENKFTQQILKISNNPVINALMNLTSGLMAVLNEQRQILSLNEHFLKMLGIKDPAKTLGLRPGEAVECIHAQDLPGGCGTSEFCSTCGAAISIVSCLATDQPAERTCALTVRKGSVLSDIFFRVNAYPITFETERFILLFLQDITRQQKWATLEKIFYHDINNIVSGLVGRCELMSRMSPETIIKYAKEVKQQALRISNEIAFQRSLSYTDLSYYQPLLQNFPLDQVLREVKYMFAEHEAAKDKNLVLPSAIPGLSFQTDLSLLLRILGNMLANALEASDENDEVRLTVEPQDDSLTFCVWNRQVIPENISLRIFQRNFSTKAQTGRGLGTYSMKLFGEQILGGKVDFTTSHENGTCFCFTQKINSCGP